MTTDSAALTAPRHVLRAMPAAAAAARYEYLMQVRRRGVWIVELALVAVMFVGSGLRGPIHLGQHPALGELMGSWALVFNIFAPLGVGFLLADRGRREHRLGLDDLLDAAPTGRGARWWGKVVGTTAASVTPIACAWVVLLAVLSVQHGPAVIPLGVIAFLAVTLPGLLFVAAFALAVPLSIGSALFRVGFVGYWFWGNLLGPTGHIPTLAGTIFEPLGEYAAAGWFGADLTFMPAAQRGIHPDAAQGALNAALILAASAAVLITTHRAHARRRQP